ncbi:MAG: ECF transporter S component [Eggerthellaceae bacterium]|nr:ECF transporter S component [Eggerthellaceae bacterium]
MSEVGNNSSNANGAQDAASRKRTILSVVVVLVLAPLTLWLSTQMGNVSYYVPSVLIVIYTMVPFFVSFESRKPGARELVMLAVMAALAVASRAAFFWLPNFKPMAGVIAIAGIALGAQSGFLVGSLSMFASNIIFGQGPWTPWQMFAYGLVGFVAGLLADHGIIPREKLSKGTLVALCCGAFVFMVLVVGPILDTSSVLTMLSTVNLEGAIPIYLAGLPVNASQGVATFLTLLLVCNPLLGMIARVKKKYGMGTYVAKAA